MSDETPTNDNVVDLRPCDTEPPCETPGYALNSANLPNPEPDMVKHPPHYNRGGVETWDIIEHVIRDYPDATCAYHVASIIKYADRAPYKGDFAENLAKLVQHAIRLHKRVKKLNAK